MVRNKKSSVDEHVQVFVKIKNLPSFSKLNSQIQEVVSRSSWMELYGWDWLLSLAAVSGFCLGVLMLRSDGILHHIVGLFLMGVAHPMLTQKAGHLSSHGAVCRSPVWNHIWTSIFVELLGSFSVFLGYDIHIKNHHPHTNIIGLGDSSTWKVPGLSRTVYMFFAPLAFPIITPLVAVSELIKLREWKELVKCIIVMSMGVIGIFTVIMYGGNLSFSRACFYFWVHRSVFAIPYIHINIFQHIGLPMYSPKDRPARIYQMATGVLNLSRNFILENVFGHSLISCHVEHHLFPRLSDHMCLKVKPLVKEYLISNGLPYNEQSYMDRLATFMDRFDELMVNAPPITHFVGIQ